jgi:hypothetical protein
MRRNVVIQGDAQVITTFGYPVLDRSPEYIDINGKSIGQLPTPPIWTGALHLSYKGGSVTIQGVPEAPSIRIYSECLQFARTSSVLIDGKMLGVFAWRKAKTSGQILLWEYTFDRVNIDRWVWAAYCKCNGESSAEYEQLISPPMTIPVPPQFDYRAAFDSVVEAGGWGDDFRLHALTQFVEWYEYRQQLRKMARSFGWSPG